jgi:hypothetical protein
MKLRLILLIGFGGFLGLTAAERFVSPGYHVISTAEAIVGRPLTPVSVAGVARRSVGPGAPGVGVAPGVGAGAPGAGVAPANRGGPVNRPGVR